MTVVRLTILGILISGIGTSFVLAVPLVWAALVFSLLHILTGKGSTALLTIISAVMIAAIACGFYYAANGRAPGLQGFLEILQRPNMQFFAFCFIPMMFLGSALNMNELLPVNAKKRAGFVRLAAIQIAYRKGTLTRRAEEIFVALQLRGYDLTTAFGRLRYAPLWVPALVSTAFVDALEAGAYEQMVRLDIEQYRGKLRQKETSAPSEYIVSGLIAILLTALIAHVFTSR